MDYKEIYLEIENWYIDQVEYDICANIIVLQDAGTDTICLEGVTWDWIRLSGKSHIGTRRALSHVMNAEVSFIAFSGFLHSWPASLIIALERKVNQSQGKVNFLAYVTHISISGQPLLQGLTFLRIVGIALWDFFICEGIVVTTLSLSTHYIEYNIYYYYYKYFYFLGVGMRARYEHANFFESTIGEKIRGYDFLLYPLDLNDPISNLVGDSLSGFDRILSFYFIDWHFLKSLELDPISNQLRLVYSIQQSEVEEKKEEKELGSLLNRAS
ncbi:hypothetical protein ACJX0J_003812 (mitochondrion) [Zea mays]